MFIDRVRAKFIAGKGGNGKASFYAGMKPSGGIGGDGADVYLEGAINMYDLSFIKPDTVFKAEDGIPGGINKLNGANGKDLIIKVPLITRVFDKEGNLKIIVDKIGEPVLLIKGGRGGLGNYHFRSSGIVNLDKSTPGNVGEELETKIQLELYSDIIFIGFPNAGKSSILNSITNADSKTASYAFTTLNPILGRLDGLTLADLPGLITGTSEGRGLGTSFVKHTKSSKLLAHFLSLDEDNIEKRYLEIKHELTMIDQNLSEKKEIIILTKSDLVDKATSEKSIEIMRKYSKAMVVCSVYDYDSLEELKKFLKEELKTA